MESPRVNVVKGQEVEGAVSREGVENLWVEVPTKVIVVTEEVQEGVIREVVEIVVRFLLL